MTKYSKELVRVNVSPVSDEVATEWKNLGTVHYIYIDSDDGKADDGKADDGKADDGKADDGKADDSAATSVKKTVHNYFLKRHVQEKKVLHCFDVFGTKRLLYVVVDMETENARKVKRGFVSKYTKIFIETTSHIQALRELSLVLVRPFNVKNSQPIETPTALDFLVKCVSDVNKKLVRNFRFRRRGTGKTFDDVRSAGTGSGGDDDYDNEKTYSSSTSTTRQSPETSDRFNEKETNGDLYKNSYVFDLRKFIENELFKKVSVVFVQGRELAFAAPFGLPVAKDIWRSNDCTKYLRFFVESTGDLLLGAVVSDYTTISVSLDTVGEFSSVSFSPFEDTMPTINEIDDLSDIFREYASQHPFELFSIHKRLCYCGVEMKIKRTVPSLVDEVDLPDMYNICWLPCKQRVYSRLSKLNCLSEIFVKLAYLKYKEESIDTNSKVESPKSEALLIDIKKTALESSVLSIISTWKHQQTSFLKSLTSRNPVYIYARIGEKTRFIKNPPVRLTFYDLISPQNMQEISRMPCRLQPFALINALIEISLEDLARVIDPIEPTEEAFLRQGLIKGVVEQFSTLHQENTIQCPVCLDYIYKGQAVLILPCTHRFHSRCVLSWFLKSNKCPICRLSIKLN